MGHKRTSVVQTEPLAALRWTCSKNTTVLYRCGSSTWMRMNSPSPLKRSKSPDFSINCAPKRGSKKGRAESNLHIRKCEFHQGGLILHATNWKHERTLHSYQIYIYILCMYIYISILYLYLSRETHTHTYDMGPSFSSPAACRTCTPFVHRSCDPSRRIRATSKGPRKRLRT